MKYSVKKIGGHQALLTVEDMNVGAFFEYDGRLFLKIGRKNDTFLCESFDFSERVLVKLDSRHAVLPVTSLKVEYDA